MRLRPDTMAKVVDALSAGTDCKIESPVTTFCVEWKDVEPDGYVGELISTIDSMPLMVNLFNFYLFLFFYLILI